jgi:pimeloyl-ACP methyl ester carboxylesterase
VAVSETRTFTVAAPDGTLLRVEEYAAEPPLEGAPTVVLAHGWTLTRRSWLPVADQLVERGLRVVAYDQRGHGQSSPLRDKPTVRQLGHDLRAVLDVVAPQGNVLLGGHSMGGMTIMAYAGLHPVDLADRVVGVVLVATSSGQLDTGSLPPVEAAFMRVASRLPRLRAGRAVTASGQRRLLFGVEADPEQVRLTRSQVAATTLPTLGRFFRALGEHDETEALSRLDGIPTVVLAGEHDKLTPPSHAHRIGELLPSARVEVLEGRGHMLMYEATDEVLGAFDSVLAAQPERR